MVKASTITLAMQWRDDGIGAFAAFRLYQSTSDWTKAQHKLFASTCKASGFLWDDRTCAWVARPSPKQHHSLYSGNPADRQIVRELLCASLSKAGFVLPMDAAA